MQAEQDSARQVAGRRTRSGDSVHRAQDPGEPLLGQGPGGGGETGTETEALEGLVEDEDDVEDDEFFAGDGESETDEDGVEDDAELEDED
ncbi:hypothetical protein V492_08125 [Pseudogymnoascus sp. VKM F-4246]|nr:hypothetical protein V492_08125 [Pseudogymnoascus sp. VKM F-4246]